MSIESHITHPTYLPGADGDGTWPEEAHPTQLGPLGLDLRLLGTRFPQIMHELVAENRSLRDDKHRLEEENRRLEAELQRIVRAIPELTRASYQQGEEEGSQQRPDVDIYGIPAALLYALHAPAGSDGLVHVALVVHGKTITASVKPGSDPRRVWASISAAVA